MAIDPELNKILDSVEFGEKLRARLKGDPDFAHALMYVFNLNPENYMSFARIVNDLRYECDQRVLRDVSDQFRLEHGL